VQTYSSRLLLPLLIISALLLVRLLAQLNAVARIDALLVPALAVRLAHADVLVSLRVLLDRALELHVVHIALALGLLLLLRLLVGVALLVRVGLLGLAFALGARGRLFAALLLLGCLLVLLLVGLGVVAVVAVVAVMAGVGVLGVRPQVPD
jgi:hypothetical protein